MIHYASDKGARAIFLFIAELNGFKKGKVSEKEAFGLECYLTGALHDLDADVEEDRKEMHENIWLERLYDDLDLYYQLSDTPVSKQLALAKGTTDALLNNQLTNHQWSTPIELDASALTYNS